jgi:hypothetical protein
VALVLVVGVGFENDVTVLGEFIPEVIGDASTYALSGTAACVVIAIANPARDARLVHQL